MGYWTVFAGPSTCGADGGHTIPAGEPVRVITPVMRRCVRHAAVPVDDTQVNAAFRALEHSAEAGGDPAPAPLSRPARVLRHPSAFHSLSAIADAFDPKAAAAGRDD